MIRNWANVVQARLAAHGAGAGGTPVAQALPALIIAGLLSVYLALEWLSDLHEMKGVPITPWNPGLGFLFGISVLCGARYAVLLACGYVLAEQIFIGERLPPLRIALLGTAVGVGYGAAAAALRHRWLALDFNLERLRDITLLLALGLGGAALACALVAAVLLGSSTWQATDLPVTLVSLFVGDAIGIAIFAPIVLRLARRLGRSEPMLPSVDLIVIAASILALLAGLHLWLGETAMRYIFVLFAPIVLAAIRHGLDGACFSLAVTQFGLILILNATGQDARTFTEVQAEMLALTLTGLIVGVVISERAALTAAAAHSALRLKALQIEADQASRLSLAGGMSSVLAHEINQPITAARALGRSAQHLIRQANVDTERAARNLDDMIGQIDHAAGIVRRMREFLRRGRPHVSTIDIPAMLHNVVSLTKGAAEEARVNLTIAIEPGLPPLFGDRTQLEQVLLNLIRNAADALQSGPAGGGQIEIGAARGTTAGHVEFHVIDNGPGLPPDRIDALFSPLHSTKQNGLGLGLAISAFIVQNHQGRIWLAASRPGHTEFRLAIPCHATGDA